jgi:hypothetical protein
MRVFYVLGLALVDAQIALYDNLVGSSVRLLQVCKSAISIFFLFTSFHRTSLFPWHPMYADTG